MNSSTNKKYNYSSSNFILSLLHKMAKWREREVKTLAQDQNTSLLLKKRKKKALSEKITKERTNNL